MTVEDYVRPIEQFLRENGVNAEAFLLSVTEGSLEQIPVDRVNAACVDPQDAVKLLKQGFSAVVKSSDITQFHDLWRPVQSWIDAIKEGAFPVGEEATEAYEILSKSGRRKNKKICGRIAHT